jgi:hypothetical protein
MDRFQPRNRQQLCLDRQPAAATHIVRCFQRGEARKTMAVGNRVTPVPPHRSGRAAFPHPAPTSDNDGKALRPSVRAPASVTRFPGSVSGACGAGSRSPRPPPFAPSPPLPVPRFCSATSSLLWRGLTSHARASSASAPRLPDAGQRLCSLWSSVRSLRFRRIPFRRDVAFDPGGATAPRITVPHMLPSTIMTGSASATLSISRLNPTPQRIAVYASQLPSPTTTQHSLPGGPLRPYPCRSPTGWNAPASPDAP